MRFRFVRLHGKDSNLTLKLNSMKWTDLFVTQKWINILNDIIRLFEIRMNLFTQMNTGPNCELIMAFETWNGKRNNIRIFGLIFLFFTFSCFKWLSLMMIRSFWVQKEQKIIKLWPDDGFDLKFKKKKTTVKLIRNYIKMAFVRNETQRTIHVYLLKYLY